MDNSHWLLLNEQEFRQSLPGVKHEFLGLTWSDHVLTILLREILSLQPWLIETLLRLARRFRDLLLQQPGLRLRPCFFRGVNVSPHHWIKRAWTPRSIRSTEISPQCSFFDLLQPWASRSVLTLDSVFPGWQTAIEGIHFPLSFLQSSPEMIFLSPLLSKVTPSPPHLLLHLCWGEHPFPADSFLSKRLRECVDTMSGQPSKEWINFWLCVCFAMCLQRHDLWIWDQIRVNQWKGERTSKKNHVQLVGSVLWSLVVNEKTSASMLHLQVRLCFLMSLSLGVFDLATRLFLLLFVLKPTNCSDHEKMKSSSPIWTVSQAMAEIFGHPEDAARRLPINSVIASVISSHRSCFLAPEQANIWDGWFHLLKGWPGPLAQVTGIPVDFFFRALVLGLRHTRGPGHRARLLSGMGNHWFSLSRLSPLPDPLDEKSSLSLNHWSQYWLVLLERGLLQDDVLNHLLDQHLIAAQEALNVLLRGCTVWWLPELRVDTLMHQLSLVSQWTQKTLGVLSYADWFLRTCGHIFSYRHFDTSDMTFFPWPLLSWFWEQINELKEPLKSRPTTILLAFQLFRMILVHALQDVSPFSALELMSRSSVLLHFVSEKYSLWKHWRSSTQPIGDTFSSSDPLTHLLNRKNSFAGYSPTVWLHVLEGSPVNSKPELSQLTRLSSVRGLRQHVFRTPNWQPFSLPLVLLCLMLVTGGSYPSADQIVSSLDSERHRQCLMIASGWFAPIPNFLSLFQIPASLTNFRQLRWLVELGFPPYRWVFQPEGSMRLLRLLFDAQQFHVVLQGLDFRDQLIKSKLSPSACAWIWNLDQVTSCLRVDMSWNVTHRDHKVALSQLLTRSVRHFPQLWISTTDLLECGNSPQTRRQLTEALYQVLMPHLTRSKLRDLLTEVAKDLLSPFSSSSPSSSSPLIKRTKSQRSQQDNSAAAASSLFP